MKSVQRGKEVRKWGLAETTLVAWVGIALLALVPISRFLQASMPIFTVIWLLVPLWVVLHDRDAPRVGFRRIPWRGFFSTLLVNLGLLILVSILVEPWSHAYRELVKAAVSSSPPDATFAWLVRFPGLPGWVGMALFTGLVTIFAEELFFRGWLLQYL